MRTHVFHQEKTRACNNRRCHLCWLTQLLHTERAGGSSGTGCSAGCVLCPELCYTLPQLPTSGQGGPARGKTRGTESSHASGQNPQDLLSSLGPCEKVEGACVIVTIIQGALWPFNPKGMGLFSFPVLEDARCNTLAWKMPEKPDNPMVCTYYRVWDSNVQRNCWQQQNPEAPGLQGTKIASGP